MLNQSATAWCSVLSKALPNRVFRENSTAYNLSVSSYWARQETELRPACVVAACATHEVAKAIHTLTILNRNESCPFAIRAGGHGKSGASSSQGGVVIDLSAMSAVTVNHGRGTVTVGVGAKWAEVYAALDPLNITVPGARSADVGVGGLTLAGGIGYLFPRIGLTVNNIIDVEMVLASGKVVHTSSPQHEDIGIAVRGGTNNFGVATAIEIASSNLTGTWGGTSIYSIDTAPQQLQAIHDFTADSDFDEYATALLSFGYSGGQAAAINNIVYTSSVSSAPQKLRRFVEIPALYSTLRPASMSDIAHETAAASPHGFRQATFTLTLINDLEVTSEAFALWNSSWPPLAAVPGLSLSFSLEPFPRIALDKTGNDVLNLRAGSEPLLVYLLSATWLNEENDDVVYSTAHDLLRRTEHVAVARNKLHPFKYIGYAHHTQNPLAGYGADNVGFMRRVSHKYDPEQLFQRAVGGGFKLSEAGV
ncbi:hypothetical protein QQS21_003271 [Conoideocrella luteorostrata]|uniref:FAD-binding PCMH-type domain-containing protein n=1 Tax=Conoideocrella luteorostrata TaxID=1105319 RepID=A0AAJ0CWG8_9HYPO|nr:hypothetical protein QQS21_003271 [Conoideocrella luteorostrata]